MKAGLELRQGLSLAMTPQLQQSIRLLQLSSLELQTEIQEALEANPMLELDEDDGGDGSVPESSPSPASMSQDNLGEAPSEGSLSVSDLDRADTTLDLETPSQSMPEDLPLDSRWDDIYEADGSTSYSKGSPEDEERDFLSYTSSGQDNLRDHLLSQLLLTSLSPRDQLIATAIIESIDDEGFLDDHLEAIVEGLSRDLPDIELDEAEAMLHLVQHFDPPGVGARDLGECLRLQLRLLDEHGPAQTLALRLLDHLDLLGARDYSRLQRVLKVDAEALKSALQVLQALNPRPGAALRNQDVEYVIPDVFVRRVNGHWRVDLNPDVTPKLRVNSLYAGYIQRGRRGEDMNFMRNALQEARWFIKSVQSRHETLLAVAEAIIRHQRDYLEHGEAAMRPLVLREIAEELELHESTVSRVTTNKYMHTPRGVVEFKFFFSSHVGTSDGGEASSTAIRARIKHLVADEPPAKPLSDSRLAELLEAEGINVARRTVAKYRESMGIPPSNERKRLC
ncbi:MAG: RNA polymerase factor sigma-54 [Pseudomonadota bacterium]